MFNSIYKFMRNRELAKYNTNTVEIDEIVKRAGNNEALSYEQRLKLFHYMLKDLDLAKKAAEFPELPELKKPLRS